MNNIIDRFIKKSIEKVMFQGKAILIFGPRQVGKTTLCRRILSDYKGENRYFNCEIVAIREKLAQPEPFKIKDFFGNAKLVVLDEAHKIKDIGLVLKVLTDTFPELQIIATGSSSFDLASQVGEPLVGRAWRFILYPLSVGEIKEKYDLSYFEEKMERMLIYGSYPEVFFLPDNLAANRLDDISSNYLYKDLLEFDLIKKSRVLLDLLRLLAMQLGNEVSFDELARTLQINKMTVRKYVDLLEKNFILFSLRSFSRNLRKEISKSVKVYFYDLGVRNSLVQNFNRLDIRNDVGALWENFCVMERIKRNHYNNIFANYYFWRTYDKKEIDFIEERDGKLMAFEFKWRSEKSKEPKEFLQTYSSGEFKVVSKKNIWEFVAQ